MGSLRITYLPQISKDKKTFFFWNGDSETYPAHGKTNLGDFLKTWQGRLLFSQAVLALIGFAVSLAYNQHEAYNAYYSFVYFFHSVSAFILMGLYLCDKMPAMKKSSEDDCCNRVAHWLVVSVYHSLSVVSYFICACISFAGFSPAAFPTYILLPIVIGDMICACIKLKKTPEIAQGIEGMKADNN